DAVRNGGEFRREPRFAAQFLNGSSFFISGLALLEALASAAPFAGGSSANGSDALPATAGALAAGGDPLPAGAAAAGAPNGSAGAAAAPLGDWAGADAGVDGPCAPAVAVSVAAPL